MADAPMTGDADRDFAAMMVPHHQGAVAWPRRFWSTARTPSRAGWRRRSLSPSSGGSA
ncbi:hypothetical protein ACIOHC_36725 [Streptomyces sp. NPDC088252]|uniref:hypothetical protein n=1 Tax=Streptomyces sp. NPDC088252 TaxID=3365845 RepID=UPI00381AC73A